MNNGVKSIQAVAYNGARTVYPVFIVLGIYNFALLQNGIRQREGSCSSVWFLYSSISFPGFHMKIKESLKIK